MPTQNAASLASALMLTTCLLATPALARTQDERIEDLERLVAAQAKRIADLEARLEPADVRAAGTRSAAEPAVAVPAAKPASQAPDPAPSLTAMPTGDPGIEGLDVSGDVRVRYEQNWGGRNERDRARGVVRARLGATYRIDDVFSVGARVVTGDPDDPNTADVTLSTFDDDLAIALDRAYVAANLGAAQITLGKTPQIFRKTDLVWDDDVQLQGTSGLLTMALGQRSHFELRGTYFLISEDALGPDSDMWGAQAAFVTSPSSALELTLAAAYYDYTIGTTAGADAGDFRGNRRRPDGGYLSDFNLVDILATARWKGPGERWPISLAADYVINRGSAGGHEDQGLALFSSIGRTAQQGDWQFGYSYLEADQDAVLAAFSHDNIPLSTDYLMHALSVDYVLRRHAVLNATLYRFREQRSALLPGAQPDWRNRMRLNFQLSF